MSQFPQECSTKFPGSQNFSAHPECSQAHGGRLFTLALRILSIQCINGQRRAEPCKGGWHEPGLKVAHITSDNILLHSLL